MSGGPARKEWTDRSRSNFEAAVVLLERAGKDPGRKDPAASRNYYAIFHFVVGELEASGKTPKSFDQSDRWRHDIVKNNLNAAPRLRSDFRVRTLFARLLARRRTADYGPGFVDLDEVGDDLDDLRKTLREFKVIK